MRFWLRLIWLSLAISLPAPWSIHERHLETCEKRFRFSVGPGRCLKDDVHTPDGFRLVVVDLDKDDVLFEAHGVVAAAIEALARDSAEVPHARQRGRDQTIEEFVHPVLAQRNLHADRPSRSDLERRDRLLRPRRSEEHTSELQ